MRLVLEIPVPDNAEDGYVRELTSAVREAVATTGVALGDIMFYLRDDSQKA